MRVYLDTGVFVDYLIHRSHAGLILRTRGRRGRTIDQLARDVSDCLAAIAKSHAGFTSSLTYYELEETLYERLSRAARGKPDRRKYVVISSRPVIHQALVITEFFRIEVKDLSKRMFERHVQAIDLQRKGLRAADALHAITALDGNADLLVSTDRHLLGMDRALTNANGRFVRCLDTNDAKALL